MGFIVEFYRAEEEIIERIRWDREEREEGECEFIDELDWQVRTEIQSARTTETQNQRIQRYFAQIVRDLNLEIKQGDTGVAVS